MGREGNCNSLKDEEDCNNLITQNGTHKPITNSYSFTPFEVENNGFVSSLWQLLKMNGTKRAIFR